MQFYCILYILYMTERFPTSLLWNISKLQPVSNTLNVDNYDTLILRRVLRLCLLGLQGVDRAQEFSLINGRYIDTPGPLNVAPVTFLYTYYLYMTTRISIPL